jgi:hypothetical protein
VPVTDSQPDPVQWPQRVLLLIEGSGNGGDFAASMRAGLEAHRCQVITHNGVVDWPDGIDLVIGYGPFTLTEGNLLPAATKLATFPAPHRPHFAWWLTEGIPSPKTPSWMVNLSADLRVRIDDILATANGSALRWLQPLFVGHRLRILGQLRWVQSHDLLDLLVVTSSQRAAFLGQYGFCPLVAPLGYDSIYGSDLNLERTVDVAFLGNLRSPRRKKLLPPLIQELEHRGIRVEQRGDLYGQGRQEFLNRSKILLNILRSPQDFVGQRYILGAANKCLVISEPVQECSPFVQGRHLVIAPHAHLADTIVYYLTHPNERLAITEQAYSFVTQELTIKNQVGAILDRLRNKDRAGHKGRSR